ncbi:MAG: hypothetical protein PHD54_14590 [Desulfuromonadaceae bacterium]|nr:hypothetical protein [Desulfuromonadaceae bacterium]
MRKTVVYLLCAILSLLSSESVFAADKTRILLALEQAKNVVNQLNIKSADSNLVDGDLAAARRYLLKAETIYKENTSWKSLLGISDTVEQEILDYAEMSEHTAKIGLSKIDRQKVEQEYLQLEKKVAIAKDKIKVLEEKAVEVATLKATTSKLQSTAKEMVALKADQASVEQLKKENALLVQKSESLQNEKKYLLEQMELLKLEKATLTGQLEAIRAEKKLDELQIKKQQEAQQTGKKLSTAERAAEFKSKLSALGAITGITQNSIVLILPRGDLIKTTAKGHQLAPDAEKQVQKLIALMGQYPEYRLSLQAFGYGKPVKQEGEKAADQIARIVRDFFALHLGVKADTIGATGETTASPLFSKTAVEPHRRIELKFTLRQ